MTSTTNPPRIGEQWPEQGGIYVGLMRGLNGQPDWHLIVASGEAGSTPGVEWGGYGKDEPGAIDRRDGLANTKALVESANEHPAAQWCASLDLQGHQDWYLPAQAELALGCINVPEVFGTDWHWSSTQYSRLIAWIQIFGVGDAGIDFKDNTGRVRAVRRFNP